MGIFVKDSNINTGTVGSQGTNTQSVTVHNTKVDVSNIERGNSDISSTSQVTTVDLGDLINEGGSKAAEAANTTITNGNINVGDTTQTSSQTSNQNMQNSNTNTENINQQGESVTKHSIDNDQTKNENVNQETGTASSKSASSGGQGGSTNQPTGTASKPAGSSSGGKSGSSSGGQGGSAKSGSMGGQGKQGAQGQREGTVSGTKNSSMKGTPVNSIIDSGDISRTGATASSQKVNDKGPVVHTGVGLADKNTGSHIGKKVKWFVKEVIDVYDKIGSTAAVVGVTIYCAEKRIEEKILDGLFGYLVADGLDFIGFDDVANELRKYAARNTTDELKIAFFENTELGKSINDKSLIKYDSQFAEDLALFSERLIKIAAATAISMIPVFGVPILLAVGSLEGMGGAAEDAYQKAIGEGKEDLSLSLWGHLGVNISGFLGAVEWMAYAELGSGYLNLTKALDFSSFPAFFDSLKPLGKEIFSKETLKKLLNPKELFSTAGESLLESADQIGYMIAKVLNGDEITKDDWIKFAKVYGLNFLLNILEGTWHDYVSGKGVDIKPSSFDNDNPPDGVGGGNKPPQSPTPSNPGYDDEIDDAFDEAGDKIGKIKDTGDAAEDIADAINDYEDKDKVVKNFKRILEKSSKQGATEGVSEASQEAANRVLKEQLEEVEDISSSLNSKTPEVGFNNAHPTESTIEKLSDILDK